MVQVGNKNSDFLNTINFAMDKWFSLRLTGFGLAVRNSQFAKRFDSLRMSFAFFLKFTNLLNQILHEFSALFIEIAI